MNEFYDVKIYVVLDPVTILGNSTACGGTKLMTQFYKKKNLPTLVSDIGRKSHKRTIFSFQMISNNNVLMYLY